MHYVLSTELVFSKRFYKNSIEEFRVKRIYLSVKYFNLEEGEYQVARFGKSLMCAFSFIERNTTKFSFL